MEKFSVLMSVYAREKAEYLREAMDSIFNQTLQPSEVVLVKDGPLTDKLDQTIREFVIRCNSLKVVSLPQNVGLGAALNEGLKHCSYELVARMDSDDICVPNRFERQLECFQLHPEYDIVGGWIDEFSDNPNVPESVRYLPETHADIKKFFNSRSPMNHVTVMFRRTTVMNAGGYQPFYLLEDYWLWGRMIKNGARFYNIQSVLVHVRGGHAMAARRGGWKYAKSEIRLQREFLRMRLIGPFTFCKNLTIRTTVRMMPNKLRTFVYRKLLRK